MLNSNQKKLTVKSRMLPGKKKIHIVIIFLLLVTSIPSFASFSDPYIFDVTCSYSGSAGAYPSIPDYLFVDASGNVIVGGIEYSASGIPLISVEKFNSSGILQWALPIDTPACHTSDWTDPCRPRMEMDSYGNVYVTSTVPNPTNAGTTLTLFTKVYPDGVIGWTKTITNLRIDIEGDLSIDAVGNFYIGGEGLDTLAGNQVVNGARVIKLDINGNIIWSRFVHAAAPGTPDHDVVTGSYYDIDSEGLIAGSEHHESAGHAYQTYITKLDQQGNILWQSLVGDIPEDDFVFQRCDLLHRQGEQSFVGATVGNSGQCANSFLLFSFDNDGNIAWTVIENDLGGTDVEMLSDGSTVVGTCDNQLLKYDAAGNLTVLHGTATGAEGYMTSVAVCSDDRIFFTGLTDPNEDITGFFEVDQNGNELFKTGRYYDYGTPISWKCDADNDGFMLTKSEAAPYGFKVWKYVPCSEAQCDFTIKKKVTSTSGTGNCNDGKIKITKTGTFHSYQHYELYWGDDCGQLYTSADEAPAASGHTFQNLSPGTYCVKVFDEACCEQFLTNIKVLCPKPSGMTATNITSSGATITWTNVSCNNGYKLQYRKAGTSKWTTKNLATNVNSYTITGLITNSSYEYRALTNCANSNPSTTTSGYSPVQTLNTLRMGSNFSTEANPDLEIYPNPASDKITVTISLNEEVYAIQILNTTGEIMIEQFQSTQNENSFEEKINVSSLPTGMYLLRIQTSDGTIIKSFVKD